MGGCLLQDLTVPQPGSLASYKLFIVMMMAWSGNGDGRCYRRFEWRVTNRNHVLELAQLHQDMPSLCDRYTRDHTRRKVRHIHCNEYVRGLNIPSCCG